MKKKMMLVFGTPSEGSRMNPIMDELSKRGHSFFLVSTGTEKEMTDGLKIAPDIFLEIDHGRHNTIFDVTANILNGVGGVLYGMPNKPDWVIVQGNTQEAFATALAAHYSKIPVAHVEAGLGEGTNTKLVSVLAQKSFSPTASAKSIVDSLCD